jgi:hypothetical protein
MKSPLFKISVKECPVRIDDCPLPYNNSKSLNDIIHYDTNAFGGEVREHKDYVLGEMEARIAAKTEKAWEFDLDAEEMQKCCDAVTGTVAGGPNKGIRGIAEQFRDELAKTADDYRVEKFGGLIGEGILWAYLTRERARKGGFSYSLRDRVSYRWPDGWYRRQVAGPNGIEVVLVPGESKLTILPEGESPLVQNGEYHVFLQHMKFVAADLIDEGQFFNSRATRLDADTIRIESVLFPVTSFYRERALRNGHGVPHIFVNSLEPSEQEVTEAMQKASTLYREADGLRRIALYETLDSARQDTTGPKDAATILAKATASVPENPYRALLKGTSKELAQAILKEKKPDTKRTRR